MNALKIQTFASMADVRILWERIGVSATMDTKLMQQARYAAILMSVNWRIPYAAADSVETHPVVSK